MDEHSRAFKVGDRVRTATGLTGTVVKPPRRYETAKGDSFTGWGVVVEEDTPADLTLTRIERELSPGSQHLVHLDRLTRIPS
jgi:preprotein translocase subunit YajC